MKNLVLPLLALAAMFPPVSASANSAKPAVFMATPEAKQYLVPVAQLMRVDEGVFELEIGKAIDLTDRKILLSAHHRRKRDGADIKLNGKTVRGVTAGYRVNLKSVRSTAGFVQDKEVCFVDVVDVALPKGASGIVTFRLHCL